VINGTAATLYIDGTDQTTNVSIGVLIAGNRTLVAGQYAPDRLNFNGLIDELRISRQWAKECCKIRV
jgi:hypothetical protein